MASENTAARKMHFGLEEDQLRVTCGSRLTICYHTFI